MQPTENYYKNLLSAVAKQFPKGHLAVASTLAVGLCLALALFPSEQAEATRQIQAYVDLKPVPDASLPINALIGTALANTPLASQQKTINGQNIPLSFETNTAPATATTAKEFTVKSGDSLSIIFQRAGLSDRDLYELFSASPDAKALRRIMPGEVMAFSLNSDKKLNELTYIKNQLTSLRFTRTEKGFSSKKLEREPEIKIAFRHASINSSLFMAGKNAGMTSNLVMELANIFAWDIDFAQDIRRGDQFKVMFEERFLDGQKIGNGAILAVEFINQGKTYKAVRYTDADGDTNYYTPDGESMRKAFLRMPVDFARISSHFNLSRKHPILHTIRAHTGTDYAAPRGTPIKAAGDGKVILAGRKGGYGNTVIIQHGQGYKTLYAHMHNFGRGVRTGTRVKQGQIIGYVGTTGLSTGPHLHYEFHVSGVPRNPMTIDFPKTVSIPGAQMTHFKNQVQTLVAQLDAFQVPTQLALADTENKPVN